MKTNIGSSVLRHQYVAARRRFMPAGLAIAAFVGSVASLAGSTLTNFTFQLTSRGYDADVAGTCGVVEFYRNGVNFYRERGCCVQCGRGYNVAAFDTNTGCLLGPVRNFDTWSSCTASSSEMTSFLTNLPDGTLIMIAVADAAGNCGSLLSTLVALGSIQITNREFRDSWGLIAVKGEGVARAEGLFKSDAVNLSITLSMVPGHCPPSSPTQFAAAVVDCATIGLSWAAPTNNGTLGVANYDLYRNGTRVSSPDSFTWNDTVYVLATTNCCYSLVATGYDGLTSAPAVACVQVEFPNSAAARPVAVWGANHRCQLVLPDGLSNAVSIAAGGDHNLALLADGTAIAWGHNGSYQTDAPIELANVVGIAGGAIHSLALRADGTVLAWGYNGSGQTNVPVGLSNVVCLAAGEGHSLALKRDGTVTAWGDDRFGQATVPVGLSGVVAISGGRYHSLALKGDGSVVAWGLNNAGQISVPADLSNAEAVSAGDYHCLTLKADGTVVAWGRNDDGQRNVPAGLSNVVAIAAGGRHSLALRADGTVAVWGNYWSGLPFPAAAPGALSNVVAIAAGGDHSLAFVGETAGVQVGEARLSGNSFSAFLPTQRGKQYRLEYKTDLDEPNWTLLTPTPGDGTRKTLVDGSAVSEQRFYRVRCQ